MKGAIPRLVVFVLSILLSGCSHSRGKLVEFDDSRMTSSVFARERRQQQVLQAIGANRAAWNCCPASLNCGTSSEVWSSPI
jgi:hypothetical protein